MKYSKNFIDSCFQERTFFDFFKRLFDIMLSITLFLLFFIPILFISILIYFTSFQSVIFWSDRIGKDNKIFKMPKFRTMKIDTPSIATHLLKKPEKYVTPIGSLLRKYSLDELPQLWSVFKGDLSFVGPRPALFNQDNLITLRTKQNVHKIVPGITGLAQINGRDKLSITNKVEFDTKYLHQRNFVLDFKIIYITIKKVINSSDIKH